MQLNLRKITFVLFGILLIFELICGIINFLILEKSILYPKTDESTDRIIFFNELTAGTGIFINILSIILITSFGLHSLYFKEKFKLALYLIL